MHSRHMSRRQALTAVAGASVAVGGPPGLGSATAQEAPRANERIWPYLAQTSPADRKAVLEREARKETGITLYGATGLDRLQF